METTAEKNTTGHNEVQGRGESIPNGYMYIIVPISMTQGTGVKEEESRKTARTRI